jgi:hypothetical protein
MVPRQQAGHMIAIDTPVRILVLALEPKGPSTHDRGIVQGATAMVLNAIYEEDFLGFSYGFRPGRGQHDALDALVVGISRTKVNWILDADIQSFLRVKPEGMLRHGQPGMADPVRGTPDRRPAHQPPDPEMVKGGCARRRGGDNQ